MHAHEEVEGVLHRLEKNLSVINIDVEFSFKCIMNQDASFYVNIIVLRVPVSLESHWNTIPSVRIHVSQTLSTNFNDSLGKNMRL